MAPHSGVTIKSACVLQQKENKEKYKVTNEQQKVKEEIKLSKFRIMKKQKEKQQLLKKKLNKY